MKNEHIIELANDYGFKINHFLKLEELNTGFIVEGKFRSFKQTATESLHIKTYESSVEIRTNGIWNFRVIRSIDLSDNVDFNLSPKLKNKYFDKLKSSIVELSSDLYMTLHKYEPLKSDKMISYIKANKLLSEIKKRNKLNK